MMQHSGEYVVCLFLGGAGGASRGRADALLGGDALLMLDFKRLDPTTHDAVDHGDQDIEIALV